MTHLFCILVNDSPDSRRSDVRNTHIGEIVISKLATLEQLKSQIMTLDSVVAHKLVIPSPAFLRISVISGGILGTVLKGSQNTLQYVLVLHSAVI